MLLPLIALIGLAVTQPTDDRSVVDHAVFDTSLHDFMRARSSLHRQYRHLDWTTDYCSAPVIGNEGRSFNFRDACLRHDFAYRNYRRLGVLDSSLRVSVDRVFHGDLVESCLSKRVSLRVRCLAWAEVFYEAVRLGGGP